MKIIIDKEFKNIIPPLEKEEYKILKESIKEEGVREPIISWKGILVDGHNRKEIADKLGIKYKLIKKKFRDRQGVILWIINNQLGRRNISNYDRTRLALKYEEILKPIALENQKNPFKNYNKSSTGNEGVGLMSDGGRTNTKIGIIANVGKDTVSKVKFIEKYADKKQKERLSTQQDSINKVYHEIKKKLVLEQKIKPTKLPKEEFNIIYADPPWKYNFSQSNERSIETHYSSMSLEQIKQMKIPTTKNAVLFLWTTAPKLEEAFEVMESWGFEYKTCAVWDKEIIGMGYWFRGQHEILLLGTKGKTNPPIPKNRFSSVIKERRIKHSKKPERVYEIIEKMFPKKNYLELFARNKRKGWVVWGNEIK